MLSVLFFFFYLQILIDQNFAQRTPNSSKKHLITINRLVAFCRSVFLSCVLPGNIWSGLDLQFAGLDLGFFGRNEILKKDGYIPVVLYAAFCYLPGQTQHVFFCKGDHNLRVSGCDRCSFSLILMNSQSLMGRITYLRCVKEELG